MSTNVISFAVQNHATKMNPKSNFSARLRSARLMNGFSLQDLANALENKLTRQAIHRYEKGEVIPDPETINLLAQALQIRPDYFSRVTKVELGEIEYRKLKKVSQKEVTVINETTREYLSRYLELEEILGIAKEFENPLKHLGPITNYDQVNEAAQTLRDKWSLGTGPLFNVVELLEDKNIKVIKLNVADDFDGLQTFVNNAIPVVAYNERKANKPDRIRFTLLHELGHLLLKFDTLKEKEKETFCHQFAGAMLLPDEAIKKELGLHRNKLSSLELGNIKKQYGISMQAIVMRAKACGIINDHYTKQFFFWIRQMNWKVDEPVDYQGIEESNRFQQLLFRALIEDQISISKASSLLNKSVAEFRKVYQAW